MYISCHLDSTKADMYNALCASLFFLKKTAVSITLKTILQTNTICILNIGTTL